MYLLMTAIREKKVIVAQDFKSSHVDKDYNSEKWVEYDSHGSGLQIEAEGFAEEISFFKTAVASNNIRIRFEIQRLFPLVSSGDSSENQL